MEYKKLKEVDIKESLSENEYILAIDENGNVVRVLKSSIASASSGSEKIILDKTTFGISGANYENNPADVKYDGYSFAELKELINNGVDVLIKETSYNGKDFFYYRHSATMSCVDEYTGESVDMLVFENSVSSVMYSDEQGGFAITTGERAFTLTPYGQFGIIWQIREGEEL